MRRVLRFLIIFSFLNSTVQLAKAGQTLEPTFFDTAYAASTVAKVLNESKNIDGLLMRLSPYLGPERMESTRQYFKANKVDFQATFPKFTANGNSVSWQGGNVRINANRTATFLGRIINPIDLNNYDNYLKGFEKQAALSSKACLWIECANAQTDPVSAAFWAVVGPYVGAAVVVTVGVVVVVGGVVLYLSKEAYESLMDGEISCNGDFFVVRKKVRNAVLLASSKDTILDAKTISQIRGTQTGNCTPKLATELSKTLKPAILKATTQPTVPVSR